MNNFIIIISFLTVSIFSWISNAEDMSHCTSFLENDPELRDYLRITPDHKLDQKYMREVIKRDPNVSIKLGTEIDDGVTVDEISFPSGTAKKTIYVRRINGKLERIELNRFKIFIGMDTMNITQTRETTQTYMFDYSGNKCFPRLGVETNGGSTLTSPGQVSTNIKSQLFDSELCHKLDDFFKRNPKALQCEQDFEGRTSKLLETYRRDWQDQFPPSFGLGGWGIHFPNSPFPSFPTISRTPSTTEQLIMDAAGDPSKASGRTKPKHESRLSLAIALHSDCQKDKRLGSTLNDKGIFNQTTNSGTSGKSLKSN